jgi:four helix bundle protein
VLVIVLVLEMPFSHEKLDVYRLALEFAGWSQALIGSLKSAESTRSQLERASTSIPLNIAEGNARSSKRDRSRFWRMALGSALECAAILDVLVVRGVRKEVEVADGKEQLERIVAMLIGLLKNLGSRVPE